MKIPKAKIRLVMQEWKELPVPQQKDLMNEYDGVYGQRYTSQDWINFLWQKFSLEQLLSVDSDQMMHLKIKKQGNG
jgi:hypothetical protein